MGGLVDCPSFLCIIGNDAGLVYRQSSHLRARRISYRNRKHPPPLKLKPPASHLRQHTFMEQRRFEREKEKVRITWPTWKKRLE